MGRKTEKFSFDNGRGNMLAAYIDLPDDRDPLHYGVFGPCFTCTKDSHGAAKVCRELAERGVAMLRFDTAGVGESGGSLSEQTFTTRVQDIIAAVHAMAQKFEPPKLLIGHSISGTAALSAVQHLPDIRLVATIGSPKDPQGVIEKFRRAGQMEEFETAVTVNVLGRIVTFNKSFVADMLSQKTEQDTQNIGRKLFVFHAPYDNIVDFENAKIIAARGGDNASLMVLDDAATHLLEKRKEDAAFIADILLNWLNSHPV